MYILVITHKHEIIYCIINMQLINLKEETVSWWEHIGTSYL